MKRLLLALLVIVLLVTAGLLIGRAVLDLHRPAAPAQRLLPQAERELLLYFGDNQSAFLVEQRLRLPDSGDEMQLLRQLIAALIAGPPPSATALVPVLPPASRLQDAVLAADGTLLLDFNRALIDQHPGGSASELLTVRALANTVSANFPEIKRVRLLVDGLVITTLKGHLDLRGPVAADFSLVRPEEMQDGSQETAAVNEERQ